MAPGHLLNVPTLLGVPQRSSRKCLKIKMSLEWVASKALATAIIDVKDLECIANYHTIYFYFPFLCRNKYV